MVQSVKHLPSTWVLIPESWDQAPTSGSLCSGEPASPFPSAPHPVVLSLSLSQIDKLKERKKGRKKERNSSILLPKAVKDLGMAPEMVIKQALYQAVSDTRLHMRRSTSLSS